MQSRGLLASEWHDLTHDQRVEVMRNAMNMFGDDINKTISRSFNTDIDRRYSVLHEIPIPPPRRLITPPRRKRKRTSQSDNRIVKAFAKASQRIAKAAFEVNRFSQMWMRIRESAEQDITKACVELEATMMAANAHNIKPEIPWLLLHAKVTELANGFKQDIEAVGAFKEESVAKKRLSEWLQEAELCVKTCTSIKDELHSYVEDAQNEQHDEHE